MKYIVFLLILFSFNCFSEKNNEFTVDITFITDAGNQDIMNFGDKLTYRNTKGTGSWKDSMGDYGIIKCLGNYLSSNKFNILSFITLKNFLFRNTTTSSTRCMGL